MDWSLSKVSRIETGVVGVSTDDAEVFSHFLDLEADASNIRMFHTPVVPGLLQTERYARSCVRPIASRAQRSGRPPGHSRRRRAFAGAFGATGTPGLIECG
jgi:hypothetical protein